MSIDEYIVGHFRLIGDPLLCTQRTIMSASSPLLISCFYQSNWSVPSVPLFRSMSIRWSFQAYRRVFALYPAYHYVDEESVGHFWLVPEQLICTQRAIMFASIPLLISGWYDSTWSVLSAPLCLWAICWSFQAGMKETLKYPLYPACHNVCEESIGHFRLGIRAIEL